MGLVILGGRGVYNWIEIWRFKIGNLCIYICIYTVPPRGGRGVVGSNDPGPGRNKEAQKKLRGTVGRNANFFITGIKK